MLKRNRIGLRSSSIFLFMIIVSGCFDVSEAGFKPGNDPFVKKLLERRLNDAGIAFNVDKEGFYTFPSDRIDKVEPLSNLAHSDAAHTKSLVVERGCALDVLRAQLDEAEVVYVVIEERGKYLLKTAAADARNFQVMERYVSAEAGCGAGQ